MFLRVGATSTLADTSNFTNLSGGFDHTTGTFNFTYTGSSGIACPDGSPCPDLFKVDISPNPGLLSQVKTSMWYTKSPIVLSNLNSWSEYTCGRILYWQISTRITGEKSAIQSSTVTNCYTFDNLMGKFSRNSAKIYFTDNGFVPSSSFRVLISPRSDVPDDYSYSWKYGGYSSSQILISFPDSQINGSFYQCGNTIYWRVLNNRGETSPTQTSVISCPSL